MEEEFDFLKIAFMSHKRLSEEEELDLVRKYQDNGDLRAYKKLQASLRPLIEKTISDATPSSGGVSSSVLHMRANAQLKSIINSYDPNQNTKLSTYVVSQLKGHMRNAVAETKSGPYVPRNQAPDLEKYRQARREAAMEFGSNPTDDQVKRFYTGNKDYDSIKDYHMQSFSSNAVFGAGEESDGVEFKDMLTNDYGFSSDDLLRFDTDDKKKEILNAHFNEREQQIIRDVIDDGKAFIKISLDRGVETSEIRKIMRKWNQHNN